jgi:PAS domain S-box-containing protein
MDDENTFYVILDTHANIIDFKGLASQISGYTASEVMGRNWFELFIPDSNLQEMLSVFQRFLDGDLSFWEYDNEITCKDGTHQLIRWKNSLRRGADGTPTSIHSQGTPLQQ